MAFELHDTECQSRAASQVRKATPSQTDQLKQAYTLALQIHGEPLSASLRKEIEADPAKYIASNSSAEEDAETVAKAAASGSLFRKANTGSGPVPLDIKDPRGWMQAAATAAARHKISTIGTDGSLTSREGGNTLSNVIDPATRETAYVAAVRLWTIQAGRQPTYDEIIGIKARVDAALEDRLGDPVDATTPLQ